MMLAILHWQVPMDVPKTALDMVNKFMHGQPW
jgi:hypothetical protein